MPLTPTRSVSEACENALTTRSRTMRCISAEAHTRTGDDPVASRLGIRSIGPRDSGGLGGRPSRAARRGDAVAVWQTAFGVAGWRDVEGAPVGFVPGSRYVGRLEIPSKENT